MNFDKKKLIIIGVVFLILFLILILMNKSTNTNADQKSGKDFDTEVNVSPIEEIALTPTLTIIPTLTKVLTPTIIPTLTPTIIPTLTPTATPTKITTPTPTIIPTLTPTKKPTATPTPDTNIYATGVVLNTTELVLTTNESMQMEARVEPNDTTDKSVYWSSNNAVVATVTNEGLIIGKTVGETTIIARTSNNKTTLVNVIVKDKNTLTPTLTPTPTIIQNLYPEKITINLSTLILRKNETKQLSIIYNPKETTEKNINWSSNNKSIVTVSSTGLLKAIETGMAVITATSENNLKDTVTVFVVLN